MCFIYSNSCGRFTKKPFKIWSYPVDEQKQIDNLINKILAGSHSLADSLWLKSFIQAKGKKIDEALLGCSELSVLVDAYPLNIEGIDIIDPLDVVSEKACRRRYV